MGETKKPVSKQRRRVKPAKGSSQLASYAVTASGVAVALGGAHLADAGIITGSLNAQAAPNQSVSFFIPELGSESGLELVNGYSEIKQSFFSRIKAVFGGDFHLMQPYVSLYYGSIILQVGDYIDNRQEFVDTEAPGKGTLAGFSIFSPARDGYVGFRVSNSATNNQTWYGWFAVSVTGNMNSGFHTAITAYAYDTDGNPIFAGQGLATAIPEPTGLAMVALGSLAVATRRWRRIGQKAAV
jgi:hypothetical protein